MECTDHYTKLAASMFGVKCSDVSAEMRRIAKQRAICGSYTARIKGVKVVEQACCKDGKVRVDVVVDHVQPQRKACKHPALGMPYGMPEIEVTPNPNPADFTRIEEHVLAMYNTGKDDKQRADEYEALLLKAFPHVEYVRREKGRPLMASDFDPGLRKMCGAQGTLLRAMRGRGIPVGTIESRIKKLVEIADAAAERGEELKKAWGELEDCKKELYKARCATSKLRDSGVFAGLPWKVGLNGENVAQNINTLQEALQGRDYVDSKTAMRALDSAKERTREVQQAARDSMTMLAFAFGGAGLAVGSILGYFFGG
ncbi:hypothetical protein [Pseudomonas phage PJNP013]|uniref:Uncharacterized protein n=1 Tax=Pseudomonas phage PJNP013 TaxID=3108093 RepID=A0ABZ2CRU6_9CAUD